MKPDALFIGDVHADDSQPISRTDIFTDTVVRKLKWLRSVWEEEGKPPVIQPGDLFNRWKCSPWTISMVLELAPPMITIPGNPGKHNSDMSEFEKDALYTLKVAGKGWRVLDNGQPLKLDKMTVYPCLWGKEPVRARKEEGKRNILVTHRMIIDGPSQFQGDNTAEFLDKHRSYSVLLTGHNHKPILERNNGRLIVNPGSFFRRSVDEDHHPRIYRYFADRNEIEPIYVPIEKEVFTRDHLKKETRSDDDLGAFAELLNSASGLEMSVRFKDNIQVFLETNRGSLREGLEERIQEAIKEG